MSVPFRFAVVGCGMAATPHALALRDLVGLVAVAGVYSRNTVRRAAFASEHNFPVANNLAKLAQDASVDALLLLTPPNAREEPIEMFAAQGKHVLCEKPLERTTVAAARIVNSCAVHGVRLGIVFQQRFRVASQQLVQLLRDNKLGAIRAVRIDVPWWRDQAYYDEPGRGSFTRDGGGVLISQAIHTLDLVLNLVGPVTAVQAISSTTKLHKLEGEDFVAAGLEFACGAPGALYATTAAYPGAAEYIRLECDHASAELTAGRLQIHWRAGNTETFGDQAATGGGADPMAFPFCWHRDLIASFVKCVRADQVPVVAGEDALAVQRLIDALLQSAAQGQRIAIASA